MRIAVGLRVLPGQHFSTSCRKSTPKVPRRPCVAAGPNADLLTEADPATGGRGSAADRDGNPQRHRRRGATGHRPGRGLHRNLGRYAAELTAPGTRAVDCRHDSSLVTADLAVLAEGPATSPPRGR